MLQKVLYILISGILFCSCASINLAPNDDLNERSVRLEVTRRYSWGNQNLSFGDYYTSNISNAGGSFYAGSLGFGLTESKSKIAFQMFNEQNRAIEMTCDFLVRGGELFFPDGTSLGYEGDRKYIIYGQMRDGTSTLLKYGGQNVTNFLIDGQTYQLIKETTTTEETIFAGYVITYKTKRLAALDIYSTGIVWLDSSLDSELEHWFSAIFSALLVQPNLNLFNY